MENGKWWLGLALIIVSTAVLSCIATLLLLFVFFKKYVSDVEKNIIKNTNNGFLDVLFGKNGNNNEKNKSTNSSFEEQMKQLENKLENIFNK